MESNLFNDFFIKLLFQTNNLFIMKNLKKIARQSLKTITGGRPPAESECIACGCPTSACYYKNGNGGGGGCADIRCA